MITSCCGLAVCIFFSQAALVLTSLPTYGLICSCRHHPDHDHDDEAPHRFIAINEAYSMLMDRKRGKGDERHRSGQDGWDFHDW